MVRKVRKKLTEELRKAFREFRQKDYHFIAVSNKEWYSLLRDEIRNSIAIEGIFASRNELLEVLEKNKKTKDQKTAAILGYYEAANTVYEYANSLYTEGEFSVRLSDLRQIHTLLMRYEKQIDSFRGKLGAYRIEDVQVANSHFTPLKHSFLPGFMDAYVRWLNESIKKKKYDELSLAALSHILFETAHPFRDGNGRVGRILLGFILIGTGFTNIAIKGIGKDEREKYYSALETSDDEFEKMLREYEQTGIINSRVIDRYAAQSDSSDLEEIIVDCLNTNILRLQKNISTDIRKKELIPLRDAAVMYGYSQDYLRNLINRKKLIAIKRGKLWFVKSEDLDKYISGT